jgi:hypothetical protein
LFSADQGVQVSVETALFLEEVLPQEAFLLKATLLQHAR